ncbi:MAG: hypothetical protein L0346_24500 [Chloroflexi bacterium]|nr:hypothetical protein [Chloroflexota bacterium]
MIPGPLLALAGPLLPAAVAFLLRRWPRLAAGLGLAALLWLAVLLAALPLAAGQTTGRLFTGDTWLVLGRSLTLTGAIRAALLFSYALAGLLFLLSLLWPQGPEFMPLTLATLSPLAGALMVRPFVFGVVLLLVAAGLLAALIQSGRPGSALASLRYLKMTVLAVPLLLVAGWMLETDQATFLATVARLFLAGFVILLAGFPFHVWAPPVLVEARPLAPVVIFGLAHLFLLLFSYHLLLENPAVQRSEQFIQWMRLSGAATALAGGLLALVAASPGRLLGYLLLIDMGATLLSFTLGYQVGLPAALSLLLLRLVGLLLAAAGLSLLPNNQLPITQLPNYPSPPRPSPLPLALLAYGALSLAGLPLTPGFSGRWAIVALAGEQAPWLAVVLLVAVAAGAAGAWRSLAPHLPPALSWPGQLRSPPPAPLTPAAQVAAALLLAAGALIALFPQLLLAVVQQLAGPLL